MCGRLSDVPLVVRPSEDESSLRIFKSIAQKRALEDLSASVRFVIKSGKGRRHKLFAPGCVGTPYVPGEGANIANPQPDKYVKVSTEVLEALAAFRIPGEVRQLIDVVMRQTWGWNKKEDEISNSQFVEATKLRKQNVSRSLSKAITHKLLVIKKDNTIRFNKDYEQWVPFKRVIKKDYKRSVIKKDYSGNQKGLQSVIKNEVDNKQKDIIKDNNTIPAENGGDINAVIKLFGNLNPSYELLFKRKNQRDAAQRLAVKYGLEVIERLVEAARQANGQEFAPVITTPCQLEDKLGALKSWYDKNNKKGVRVWKVR